jgi:cystathionine gamma-lyase
MDWPSRTTSDGLADRNRVFALDRGLVVVGRRRIRLAHEHRVAPLQRRSVALAAAVPAQVLAGIAEAHSAICQPGLDRPVAVVAEAARRGGALVAVDNTFLSPALQQPIPLGADLVVHSTTKYLNGHSDVVGGLIVVDDDELAERLHFIRKSTGGVPGPMDCWLVLRGTKTLHLRMGAHNGNGEAVARFLEAHPASEAVFYPGLESHPQHELARRQMSGFTGMVSVELGSGERAKAFVDRTRLFALAESLGGVESLIGVPALMTHASVPVERRNAMGVTDGLVRLSVGIEVEADVLGDLEQALVGL